MPTAKFSAVEKTNRKRRGAASRIALAACALALLAGGRRTADAQTAPAQNPLEQFGNALIELVNRTQPYVVTIQARPHALVVPKMPRSLTPQQRDALPPEKQKEYDESLERSTREIAEFFRSWQDLMKTSFTGSGFVLRGGFIITTAEVAERIEEPTIVFADGRRAEVLWTNIDSAANIAALKIAGPSDFGMDWGDSAALRPGAIAVVIGSQGEFPRSVSLGIISGLGRAGRSGWRRYENLIQFQGAVGPGGSGGPLLNARGELIGMVVAAPADVFASPRIRLEKNGRDGQKREEHFPPAPPAMTPFSGLSNMGFALAASDLRPIAEMLCRHEKRPPSGYIGILLSSDTESSSPKILGVRPNSPAAKAGLLPGDTITVINGQPFRMAAELRAFAGRVAVGETLKITLRRGEETRTASLVAEKRPESPESRRAK